MGNFGTADKIIVNRTKASRNAEVARAVRKTRDRLSQQAGSPVYDRELLKLHARSILGSTPAISVLILLIAAGGQFAGMGKEILVWAPVSILCHLGLAAIARRVDRAEVADIDVATTQRTFLFGHFVSWISWA